MRLPLAKFEEHSEELMGYCHDCDDVTTEDVESSEMNGRCSKCEGIVYSVENARMYGYIEITEEQSDEDLGIGVISFSDDDE